MIQFTVNTKPVSVNSCYSQNKFGRRFMTNEGKRFKEEIGWAAKHFSGWEMDQRLSVSITYYFPTAASDIDGSNKLVLDAMQGILYENDRQVEELHCYKFKDKNYPRIEIIIKKIET